MDSIDTENSTVIFAKPIHNGIGNKYTSPEGNGRESYWVMNLLEEIDEPGEWDIDFKDRKLDLLPPEGLAESEILLLDRSEPVISLNDASHIVLRELLVEGNLGDGIRVTGGSDNLIAGCEVRNVNRYAVVLDGGKNHRVLSSDLHHLGTGGAWLGGGDATVDPPIAAGHEVVNNHIHHFARIERVHAPGVNCGFTGGGGGHHTAVGMRVAHNLIHDTPHGGVRFGSLNSLFEHKVHGNIVRLGSSGKRGTALIFKKAKPPDSNTIYWTVRTDASDVYKISDRTDISDGVKQSLNSQILHDSDM